MGQSKFLHSANVIVSIVGTVGADTATGGAASAVSGLLSLREVIHRFNGSPPDLSNQVAETLEEALNQQHLNDAQKAHIPQIIDQSNLTPADVMASARRPDEICTLMLRGLTDPALTEAGTQDAFRRVVTPILRDLLAKPEVTAALQPAFQDAVAQSLRFIAEQVERLTRETSDTAKRLGAQEALVCDLARRYAPGSEGDFNSARLGLEQALEAATDLKRRAVMPSNLDDQVRATLAEVVRLNDLARLAEGKAVLDAKLAALADEVAERTQAQMALMDAGVEQARAMNDGAAAVGYVQGKLVLERGLKAFEALLQIQNEWFDRGHDQGLLFDLDVSVNLSYALQNIAINSDQRGAALHSLGLALTELGWRGETPNQLWQAESVFKLAMVEWSQEKAPDKWVKSKSGISSVLAILSERAPNPEELLRNAIAGYKEVLEIQNVTTPHERAMTLMGLGSALRKLGFGKQNSLYLDEATEALEEALQLQQRKLSPVDWAATQMILGNTLSTASLINFDLSKLERATDAYYAAIDVFVEKVLPARLAPAKMNLGVVLTNIGRYKRDISTINKAIAAHQDAISHWNYERSPFDWARTKSNLSDALRARFEIAGVKEDLTEAIICQRSAVEFWQQDGVPGRIKEAESCLRELLELQKTLDVASS